MNNNQIQEINEKRKVNKKIIWISVAGFVVLILACIFLFKTPAKVSFVTGLLNNQISPIVIDEKTGQIEFPADPKRNGFYFTGWYTDKDCTNKWDVEKDRFAKKSSVTGLYEKKDGKYEVIDTTLYAGWELDVIEIIYNLDGGTNHSNNPENFTVKHEPTEKDIALYGTYDKAREYTLLDYLTLGNPTKAGFEFGGWYTDSEFKNPISTIDRVNLPGIDNKTLKTGENGFEYYGQKPLVLYAKWIQK